MNLKLIEKKYILAVFFLLGTVSYLLFTNTTKVEISDNPSRLWMEYAMDIVREKKPTPPESARFYASIATAYYEGITSNAYSEKSEKEKYANLRTAELINYLYSDKKASTTDFLTKNNLTVGNFPDEAEMKKDLSRYIEMYNYDKAQTFVNNFKGQAYWIGEKPLSPESGKWKRWNLEGVNFTVKDPPAYKSPEQVKAVEEVRDAASIRTSEQAALINFWGGVPGTEAPSGIWQNRFYNETKNKNLSDEEYARVQSVLAQALSDSFMECWKVKFKYFTKRPNMVAKDLGFDINLAMPNPNFPSYTSGHSTISATAATVLGYFYPDLKNVFMQDAVNAKNSRLWAGIHYSYDNEEGFALGEKIGQEYITKIIH